MLTRILMLFNRWLKGFIESSTLSSFNFSLIASPVSQLFQVWLALSCLCCAGLPQDVRFTSAGGLQSKCWIHVTFRSVHKLPQGQTFSVLSLSCCIENSVWIPALSWHSGLYRLPHWKFNINSVSPSMLYVVPDCIQIHLKMYIQYGLRHQYLYTVIVMIDV